MKEYTKQMIYSNRRKSEIIAEGEHNGVRYYVINRGLHPCAYIGCNEEFVKKHINECGDIVGINVHGGVTFDGTLNDIEEYVIGWDYGHCADWDGFFSDEENLRLGHRKYATTEIVEECKSAIDDFYRMVAEDSIEAMYIANAERTINGLADEQKAQLFGQLLDKIKTSNYELYKSFVLGYEG